MRIVQGVIFLAFLGAVGLFALQNTHQITVQFLSSSLSAPVALLVVAVYLLGMLSGWTVVAFVSNSLRRVRQRD